MANYAPSTRGRIADIKNGLFVESSESEWDIWGKKVQRYYFRVYNRIIVHALFAEVTETIAGAVQTVFNYKPDTPAITLMALSTVHASIDTYVPGTRITYIGGSVAAAAITLSTGTVSYLPSTIPTVLGMRAQSGVTSIGRIGFLSSVTDATDGTLVFGLLYTPLDEGAWVEVLI